MSQQYDDTNRGVLFKNDRKAHENQPDYKGQVNVDGVEFWLSAWIKTGQKGKFMSLSVTPKEEQQAPSPQRQQAEPRTHGQMRQAARTSARPQSATGFDDMDSDIPF
jgi:hypothetical protein